MLRSRTLDKPHGYYGLWFMGFASCDFAESDRRAGQLHKSQKLVTVRLGAVRLCAFEAWGPEAIYGLGFRV